MIELDVPESWAVVTFDLVASVDASLVSPKDYPSAPHIAPDNIEPNSGKLLPYRSIAEDKVTSNKYQFRAGQIIYSKIRPYLAKATLVDFAGLCSADMYPISTAIESRYLLKWILSPAFTMYAASGNGRALLPKINREELAKIPVPIPPLAEQSRIVAKIESTSQKIKSIENAVKASETLLTKFRESLLAKAFRGQLVQQDPCDEPASALLVRVRAERAKSKTGKNANKDDLPPITEDEIPFEIPRSWQWVRLGEVASRLQNGLSKRDGAEGIPTPVLRLSDIEDRHFAKQDLRKIRLTNDELAAYGIARGDLMFVRVNGSASLVGKLIDTNDVEGFAFSDHLIRLTLRTDLLLPEFALAASMTPIFRHPIERLMVSSAGQNTISQSSLASVPLPLPPLAEQRRIMMLLQEHVGAEKVAKVALTSIGAQLRTLLSSTMVLAFSGRLVGQDPAEGTGHDLLRRLNQTAVQETPSKNSARRARA